MSKAYPHLGKRVLNLPTGKLGRVVSAQKRERVWWITARWDDDGRMVESPAQMFWLHTKRVPECLTIDLGDVIGRRLELIDAAAAYPLFQPPRVGWHVLYKRRPKVGDFYPSDAISVGRDGAQVKVTLVLWGVGVDVASAATVGACLEALKERRAFAA